MGRCRVFIKISFIIFFFFVLENSGYGSDSNEPEFLAQLTNMTVPQGRDVYFTCVVNNLGQYKVAWIKSDSKAILGIHTHMVSLNPRLSVTHNGHNTWKLHISHVQLNDSGSYMCQVNTDPMKSISGNLDVVVPPDILSNPHQISDNGESSEGGSISLFCSATGVPRPQVQWRREKGKDIMLRTETRDRQAVKQVNGEVLTLNNIQRSDMGGYLCIASNGIPPSVSKRFDVQVNFPPNIKAVDQLVVAPVEREVTLECIVEAYPKALNSWYRNEGNLKLHNSKKYNSAEEMVNLYTWHLNLTIRNLASTDFGTYVCSSVNAHGKNEAKIRLQELRMQPKSTVIPVTTQKPKRKQVLNQNKVLNEVIRSKETHFTHQMQSKGTTGSNSPQGNKLTNTFSTTKTQNVDTEYTSIIADFKDFMQEGHITDGTKLSKVPNISSTPRSPWMSTSGTIYQHIFKIDKTTLTLASIIGLLFL